MILTDLNYLSCHHDFWGNRIRSCSSHFFSVKMSNHLKCKIHFCIYHTLTNPENASPDILFICNSEPSCLHLDANNNEWMILFAFLVLNLYVKIKICFGLPHEFLQVFHVLLSHVNSRCFFFFFFLTAGLACLPASWPLSLLPSLTHSLSSLQESLQVKKSYDLFPTV